MKLVKPFLGLVWWMGVAVLFAGCTHNAVQKTTTHPSGASSAAVIEIRVEGVESLDEVRISSFSTAKETLYVQLQAAVASRIAQEDQRWHLQEGSLEQQLRQKVRDSLDLLLEFDLVRIEDRYDAVKKHYSATYTVDTPTQRALLQQQLHQLNQQLLDYRHATDQGSELDQIWSLAPALPTLESLRIVKAVWVELFGDLPDLQHPHLALLMDLQLKALFGRMNVSPDSLTAETAAFEPALIVALRESGLHVSARRPSLMVRYYIEQYVEEDVIELITDIELNSRSGELFARFNDEIFVEFEPEEPLDEVKEKAYALLANHLKDLILDGLYNHIHAFNKHRFGR